MPNSRLKTLQLSFVIAMGITASAAYACEFHSGFGAGPWSRYGQGLAASALHSPTHTSDKQSKIKLKAPAMVNATQNQQIELPINYTYNANSYTGNSEEPIVELELETNSAITAVDEKLVILNGKNGQHTFSIVPNKNGVHRLVVIARTVNLTESFERRQTIYLSVAG